MGVTMQLSKKAQEEIRDFARLEQGALINGEILRIPGQGGLYICRREAAPSDEYVDDREIRIDNEIHYLLRRKE